MPGRILTLQRQARELGRLRAGLTEPNSSGKGTHPARSKTWILTSHQRDYLDAAAEQWGGTVQEWTPQGGGAQAWRLITTSDSIDAIMPPGDPLSQHYEMWSKGGCQRRCDGETEQLSAKPCLCLARFGEDFHQQPPESACRPHTRLNLILPDVPDVGVWRMETKGFYSANEIAAAVDLIRGATGGSVMVPVRLRIEPRKRVANGQTKQFPVIVVEIRGATAGQVLAGNSSSAMATVLQGYAAELPSGSEQPAISAGPAEEPLTEARVLDLAKACKNLPQVQQLWRDAVAAEVLTDKVKATLTEVGNGFAPKTNGNKPGAVKPVSAPPVDAETEPDADAMWAAIVAASPFERTSELEADFIAYAGKSPTDANGWELETYLGKLKNQEVAA
jgi:hypothetical protein